MNILRGGFQEDWDETKRQLEHGASNTTEALEKKAQNSVQAAEGKGKVANRAASQYLRSRAGQNNENQYR